MLLQEIVTKMHSGLERRFRGESPCCTCMRIQIPSTHVEASVVVCICNREAETGETGRFLELTGQPEPKEKKSKL